MAPFWITTSWDDGHVLDLRLADLLERCGLTGTFYIARDYLPERMAEPQIAALAGRHEIGAHTLTHPILTQIDPAQARREIADSQAWLEDVIGKPVSAFCYPRGAVNAAVRGMVAEAGCRAARTVEQYRLDAGRDALALPTTVHLYPFPLRPVLHPLRDVRARVEPLRRVLPHLIALRLNPAALRSWRGLALALLDRAAARGGVWHLWGHSWEIERYGLWDDLEAVLLAAAQKPGARPVTNSALVDALGLQP